VAIDYGTLRNNLRCFYDFQDKVVLYVGAAGRQLLDPSIKTRKLIAIDQDVSALQELKANVEAESISKVELLPSRFENITVRGDVVYFEFCLHEMADPERALHKARTLAPDTVVFDHLPDSDWVFHAAEEDEVLRSVAAMERFGVRCRQQFSTNQHFRDHAELLAKVSVQGAMAVERAQRFAGTTDIVIPMRYGLALL
jgi:ubiquinone/menaquinone biosynthesis C-methylase UbiE